MPELVESRQINRESKLKQGNLGRGESRVGVGEQDRIECVANTHR